MAEWNSYEYTFDEIMCLIYSNHKWNILHLWTVPLLNLFWFLYVNNDELSWKL